MNKILSFNSCVNFPCTTQLPKRTEKTQKEKRGKSWLVRHRSSTSKEMHLSSPIFLSRMIFIHFHLTHSFGTLLSNGSDTNTQTRCQFGKVFEFA